VEVVLHPFLTFTLDGGEWSSSCSSCLTPWEIAAHAHWLGGWVGLRVGLDALYKRKIIFPLPGIKTWFLSRPACSIVSIPTKLLWPLLASTTKLTNWLAGWLTPWSRVLPEKLTGLQLVKKFPISYRTWKFSTVFTRACHLSLSWARSIQSMPSIQLLE